MKESTGLQLISAYLAHILSVVAMVLTLVWAGNNSTSQGFLGGYDSEGTVVEKFNLHPVYMVASMIFLYSNALLSWRTIPVPHSTSKSLHACLQTAALVLMGLGTKHAFEYANSSDGANLYTLHSWLGVLVVSLFSANYLGGIVVFANPYVDGATKGTYLPLHQYLGLITFVLSAFQVLTGIQEYNLWLGACDILVDQNEIDPAFQYHKMEKGCKVSNGLGIVVFLLTLTTLYATTDLQIGRTDQGKKGDYSEASNPIQVGLGFNDPQDEVL